MKNLKYRKEYPFKPFVFIGELLSQNYNKKKPIVKDYFLKVADNNQIDAIKCIAKTDELLAIKMRGSSINIYENDIIITPIPNGISKTVIPLNTGNHKYWIIELSEYLRDYNLYPSLSLMSKDLTVIAEIGQIGAYRFDHLKAAVFYSDSELTNKKPIEINDNDIEELNFIYESIETFKNGPFKSSSIEKSLNDFLLTRDIEYSSPFKIIALFSVIESLLTTNNKNTDQSINRQLQKKIKLINNQIQNKIIFTDYFKGPNTLKEELILEKLYAYRSKVAHGDYYDFNNELQVLVDHKTTFDFLNLLTKKLLLYAVNNCQLILDLKEC